MVASFAAPYTPPAETVTQMCERGFAVLRPADVRALCGVELTDLQSLLPSWGALEVDHYLKDGGNYRRRRHSCFVVADDASSQAPHRAHWQSLDYNALHGGMQRWFEPVSAEVAERPGWTRLLIGLGRLFSQLKPVTTWFVEAHQFRIDTAEGIGRPTPEGAHRDGVDFVAVFVVARSGVKGGETRVFEADGPEGQRFTLTEPWSLLLLDDARMIHESTPIQPDTGAIGHRDTLVLTYRAGGFQGGDADA